MPYDSAEAQREFKQRMYDSGYKQMQLWVHRGTAAKSRKPDIADLVRYVDKQTRAWSETRKAKLIAELIMFIEAKTEARPARKK